jgi:hypothetical protein
MHIGNHFKRSTTEDEDDDVDEEEEEEDDEGSSNNHFWGSGNIHTTHTRIPTFSFPRTYRSDIDRSHNGHQGENLWGRVFSVVDFHDIRIAVVTIRVLSDLVVD